MTSATRAGTAPVPAEQVGTGPAPTASQVLAEFVEGLTWEQLPADVVSRARYLLLDTVGVALSNVPGSPSDLVRAVLDEMGGAPVSRVWGTSLTTSPPMAALANGMATHLSDFDDTHAEAGLHASATVVPAVLAIADARRLDGRAVLTALVAGYEVACRLGAAAPHVFTLRRWHATPTCGAVASAAAVGRAIGLDADRLTAAMGIASSMASGTLQALEEGSPVKAMHPGWAAHSGVWAALLAEQGLPGPVSALDGHQGFFAAFIGRGAWSPDRLTQGLGTEWETTKVISKPYPCCHFLHALVDAAAAFRVDHTPEDIAEVVCTVPGQAEHVVCEPWAEKSSPASAYAARFSLPYVVATALTSGDLTEDDFTESALAAVAGGELIAKVGYSLDQDPRLAETYGAELVVRCTDGREWRRRVVHPTGSAATPLTESDLQLKFQRCARRALTDEQVAVLQDQVLHLETVACAADLAVAGVNQTILQRSSA